MVKAARELLWERGYEATSPKAIPELTALAMSVASPDDAGLASGLFNTTQQVGGALGLAILATLATSRAEGVLADGQSTASALTGGYHLAFAAIDGQEAKRRGVSVRGIEQVQFAPANAKRLAERGILEAAAGWLRAVIRQTFPLEKAADAHAAI